MAGAPERRASGSTSPGPCLSLAPPDSEAPRSFVAFLRISVHPHIWCSLYRDPGGISTTRGISQAGPGATWTGEGFSSPARATRPGNQGEGSVTELRGLGDVNPVRLVFYFNEPGVGVCFCVDLLKSILSDDLGKGGIIPRLFIPFLPCLPGQPGFLIF